MTRSPCREPVARAVDSDRCPGCAGPRGPAALPESGE